MKVVSRIYTALLNPYLGYSMLKYKLVSAYVNKNINNYQDMFDFELKSGFLYTRLRSQVTLGYEPNLFNPKTLNEKLIHRRLFSRDPIWPIVTCKIEVRKWLGEQSYLGLVDLINANVAYSVEEVLSLPIDRPVVVKAAWASGMNLFVSSNEELQQYKDILQEWYDSPYAVGRLIWAANSMKRGFIVEDSIASKDGEMPLDYKFFCFDGKAAFMQITFYESNKPKIMCFSREGKEEKWTYVYPKPNLDFKLDLIKFNLLLEKAEKIAEKFSFIRVDLYFHNGKVYFGELTQTPTSGFGLFTDPEVALELGEKWNYPNIEKLGDKLLDNSEYCGFYEK
ncbi:hypothetical protein HVA01_33080 [Halovibrio variabilis]|uniref:Glycosyl transferase n=1 Tax=Halovibrio variabilis TaxID=31910 RepID=A0A511UWZ2_9GAMM|nr:ATP-grasp fold amidoligase family protein [Halovibrio variabilis]GEN29662.1 hypothetical protein HVA01_33080 [Halovibrio variabilis]